MSRGSSFKGAMLFGLLLLTCIPLIGCGGGFPENKELKVGVATGWDENAVVANLTKQLLEEELGYGAVELQELELDLVFQGVGDGELDAFQDVWLPNHQAQLEDVEDDVVLLDPWYEGETEFGIAVPTYMDTTSILDLNGTNVDQILGIEPGAVIMEQIPDETVPTYNLRQELVESSTPGMLSEVDNLYGNQEEFAFVAWKPHWMNEEYDFKYLEDPKDGLGNLNDGATITSIVNEDLPNDDPVAYAFLQCVTLTEEQVNEIEAINPDDYAAAVSTWLEDENNREDVQSWIDAAEDARG